MNGKRTLILKKEITPKNTKIEEQIVEDFIVQRNNKIVTPISIDMIYIIDFAFRTINLQAYKIKKSSMQQKIEMKKVININTPNQLSPTFVNSSNCSKIIPNKFTFLKTNQIITTYVQSGNVLYNQLSYLPDSENKVTAYDDCETQKYIYEELKRKKQLQAEKALNNQRKCHQAYQQQVEKNKIQLQKKVREIELMIEGTYMKAADIMLGRNNSLFARKPKQEISPLKEMKQYTCDKSLKKLEATRKVMTNKSYQILKTMPLNKKLQQQTSVLSQSFSTGSASSLLESSKTSNNKATKKKTEERQQKLKNLLKTHSFEDLYNAKRRQASNQGFGMYWQMGNTVKKFGKIKLFKQDDKKQKVTKKVRRPQFKDYQNQIYTSESCEMIENKRYSSTFAEHADKYALQLKAQN